MSKKIIFNAVGDVWFGDHPVAMGHGVHSTVRRFGPHYLFEKVGPLLENGDINFCNLETVLSEEGLKKWYLPSKEMRGFPECVKALKIANFNLVSVANNHMLQHGVAAFQDTLRLLDNNGIHSIGVDDQRGTVPFIYKENDLNLAFLGFSLHSDEYFDGRVIYSYRQSQSQVLQEVQRIRREFEGILIVSLHWGAEFIQFPSNKQVTLGHALIDAGVSVVIGHHPHVLQGIDTYQNGLIAYSLGNFLFDLWEESTKQSVILHIKIDYRGVKDFKLIPVYIGQKYQPRLATGSEAEEITDNLKKYSEWVYEKSIKIDEEEYLKITKSTAKKFRFGSYKYFLGNLWRYHFHILLQTVLRTIFRKISKLLIRL